MSSHENDLIIRFKDGDASAFKAIYKEWHHQIYKFCRHMTSPEDAEDITADIFCRLWRAHADLHSITNIRAFLLMCARNACIDHLRTLKARSAREMQFSDILERQELIFTNAEIEAEVIARIKAEMDKLPTNSRKVLNWAFYEGYSNAEIAAFLGIHEKTVRNLKSNALRSLKIVVLKDKTAVGFLIAFLYRFFDHNQ